MAEREKFKRIWIGDTFAGNFLLYQVNAQDPRQRAPFQIPTASSVEVHFPAAEDGTSVVLSTANAAQNGTGTEVTVTSGPGGAIAYIGGPTKSALLNPSDCKQPVTVVVTDPVGNITTFVQDRGVLIQDRPIP